MAKHLGTAANRLLAIALTGAAILALAGPAFAVHHKRISGQHTPQGTVRDFLTAAVINHDQFTAGQDLTPAAERSVTQSASHPDNDVFFGSSHLTLGGLAVLSTTQLHELTYTVTRAGADRIVRVSHGGQSITFRLQPSAPNTTPGVNGPRSPWRVASGVTSLDRAQPSTGSPKE